MASPAVVEILGSKRINWGHEFETVSTYTLHVASRH